MWMFCFCDVSGGGKMKEEEAIFLAISSRTICWKIHQKLVRAKFFDELT